MIITEVKSGEYPVDWTKQKFTSIECEICGITGWIKSKGHSWNNQYKCFYCDCEYFDEDMYM